MKFIEMLDSMPNIEVWEDEDSNEWHHCIDPECYCYKWWEV